MFETLIVQPIFNLLVLIYALLPGHDFGLSVIVFTVVIRFLLWPLLKKQLHQTRKLRAIQPEIKKIRATTQGDKQRQAELLMALYKERGVSPFGSIGILFLQIPILLGLFQGLNRLANSRDTILELSYDWVQNIGWMKEVKIDLSKFDESLLGFVDLTRGGFGDGGTYWPVIVLALLAALLQYFQTSQLSPSSGESRTLRQILKDESNGKRTDQAEINAAMGRNLRYIFPGLTFVIASTLPGALALYWATGSAVGFLQQRAVLNQDVDEMEKVKVVVKDNSNKKPASRGSKSKRKK